jgi:hypothetical protein
VLSLLEAVLGRFIRATLTDLSPNKRAFQTVEQVSEVRVRGEPSSVSAFDVPSHLGRFQTLEIRVTPTFFWTWAPCRVNLGAHICSYRPERERTGMMRSRLGMRGIVVAAALTLLVAAAYGDEAKKAPDGRVKFSGGSVAAGIGYTWGSGTLTYKGKKYPITVSGLSAGASAGASSITASGSVYNLKKIEDFDGNYTAAATGATAGGGVGVVTMKNQNGVVIDSLATTRGLKLSLDAGGVNIKIKK